MSWHLQELELGEGFLAWGLRVLHPPRKTQHQPPKECPSIWSYKESVNFSELHFKCSVGCAVRSARRMSRRSLGSRSKGGGAGGEQPFLASRLQVSLLQSSLTVARALAPAKPL